MATPSIDPTPARPRTDEVVGAAVIVVLAGMVFPFGGVLAAVLLRRTLLHDHPTAQRVLLGVAIAIGVLFVLGIMGTFAIFMSAVAGNNFTP